MLDFLKQSINQSIVVAVIVLVLVLVLIVVVVLAGIVLVLVVVVIVVVVVVAVADIVVVVVPIVVLFVEKTAVALTALQLPTILIPIVVNITAVQSLWCPRCVEIGSSPEDAISCGRLTVNSGGSTLCRSPGTVCSGLGWSVWFNSRLLCG